MIVSEFCSAEILIMTVFYSYIQKFHSHQPNGSHDGEKPLCWAFWKQTLAVSTLSQVRLELKGEHNPEEEYVFY